MISTQLHMGGRVPLLGALRIDILLAAAAMITGWASRPAATKGWQPDVFERTVTRRLYILFAYIALTLPFVQWPGSVLKGGIEPYFRAVIFFWLVSWCIRTPEQLVRFLYVFVACQTWRILEPLYLHYTTGYWGNAAYLGNGEFMARLSGAPSDTINANGLAYLVVSSVPLIYYISQRQTGYRKLACWLVMGAAIQALLLTGSRSGFLVFMIIVGLWIWQSKYKAAAIVAMLLAVVIVTPMLSEQARDRYLSIFSSDTKNAATSEGRLTGLKEDFEVALRRPLFGHGLSTSREAGANFRGVAQPSHNLYTEVAQELGFIGLGIFLSIIVAAARAVLHAVRLVKEKVTSRAEVDSRVALAANCVLVLLIVNLIFSLASYGLFDSTWYLLAGLAVVTARFSTVSSRPVANGLAEHTP